MTAYDELMTSVERGQKDAVQAQVAQYLADRRPAQEILQEGR